MPELSAQRYNDLINQDSPYRKSLNKKIIFFRQNPDFEPLPRNIGLIIFRNKLLNLTPEYQNHIFDKITGTLMPGGFIVIGFRENMDDYLSKYISLEVFERQEKIYRKRIKQRSE